ncbi:MAG: ribosomal protein S18-alanine N-acetyltransferase [Anaerolineales bacterium]|nr:ribosomal protein S18-alanine N-acetyltransferase [Anaerolineales bacterium]
MKTVVSDLRIRPMILDDLPVVISIDRLSFPIPWSERSYRYELQQNPAAHLLVAEKIENGLAGLVGYIGYWFLIDEIHISTIAVHPEHRRGGIGRQLLEAALGHGIGLGATVATLEVRISNEAAVNLYREFGFEIVGRRRNYYRDNNEDAWLMTLEGLGAEQPEESGGVAWVRRRNSRPSPRK